MGPHAEGRAQEARSAPKTASAPPAGYFDVLSLSNFIFNWAAIWAFEDVSTFLFRC
jgi:hypothetical protein